MAKLLPEDELRERYDAMRQYATESPRGKRCHCASCVMLRALNGLDAQAGLISKEPVPQPEAEG